MIDVKIGTKAKKSGTTGGSSQKTTYINGTISEADHASRADKAKKAETAEKAEYAVKAGNAQTANYAQKAGELDEDAMVLERYVRKDIDDTVHGQLTLEKMVKLAKGLQLGDGNHGIDENGNAQLGDVVLDRMHDPKSTPKERVIIGAQGFDLYMGDDGKSHLYIDDLSVRNRLFASSMEIRKVSYAGGTTIFSNAGSTIAKVAVIFDEAGEKVIAYKCYAKADDGTTATANWWKPGMMGLCQTFNIKAGIYEGVQNRYYWRLCIGAGQEYLDDGKLYDYFTLSNLESFSGADDVQPDSEPQILANELGELLQFDGVLVSIVSNDEYTSFAEVLAADGITKDNAGTEVKTRRFFGFDPQSNAAPAVGDVVVNVGDQVRWNQYGNIIKLSTSVEDNGTDTAPSIAMYHGIGAPRRISSTMDGTSVWQWKEMTSLVSPTDVMYNAKNFRFITYTDEGDMIDVGSVYDAYELTGSYGCAVRATDGSYTPALGSISFSLSHRIGNHIETVSDFTLRGIIDGKTYALANKKLSDLAAYLKEAKMVKLEALVGSIVKASIDYPVMEDGQKGDPGGDGNDGKSVTIISKSVQYAISSNGTSAPSSWSDSVQTATDDKPYLWTKTTVVYSDGNSTVAYSVGYKGKNGINGIDGKDGTSVNIQGSVKAHYSTFAELSAASKLEGEYFILDSMKGMTSYDDYTEAPCLVRYMNAPDYTWYVTSCSKGDGYLVDGNLWVNDGSAWQNVGNIQGPQGEQGIQGKPGEDGSDAINIVVTPSVITYDTDADGSISGISHEKSASVYVYRGEKKYSNTSYNLILTNALNCQAKVVAGNSKNAPQVTITDISTRSVSSTSGNQKGMMPYTCGQARVIVSVDGIGYTINIPFQVNINAFVGRVYWDNKEFTAEFTNLKDDLGSNEPEILKSFGGSLKVTAAQNMFANYEGLVGADGKITKTSEAGLVTQADFAGLFATAFSDNQGVVKSEIKSFITSDDAGKLISNATIEADKINLTGHTMAFKSDQITIDSTNFKLDASGNVSMTGKINATSGNIGVFLISPDGYKDSLLSGTWEEDQNPDVSRFTTRMQLSKDLFEMTYKSNPKSSDVVGNDKFCRVSISMGTKTDSMLNPVYIKAYSNIEQTAALVIDSEGAFNPSYAIYARKGAFAGFRPAVKITTSSMTLSDEKWFIICENSSAITITLPSSPEKGQMYYIRQANANVTIKSSGGYKMYGDCVDGNSSLTSNKAKQMNTFIFSGSVWYANFYNG